MYLVLLFSTTTASFAAASGWAATYGGNRSEGASSIEQTSDGGYIVVGQTNSFGATGINIWVLKLAPDGTVEWQKKYGGPKWWDEGHSIQQTSDGGYIVTGMTRSFAKEMVDLWVLKLRADGTIEWQKTYGGRNWDRSFSIRQTTDGGYIVAGETKSFGPGHYNIWVLKLRPDGTIEWQKTYGGAEWDEARSIQQTGDGGYIIVGQTSSFGTRKGDIWVLKLRPDGTIEWKKAYGGYGSEQAASIQQTGDGGYIVTGETESFGAGGGDLWVLRLKPDGAIEWQKTYGGAAWDEGHSVQQTTDGTYIVAGVTGSFSAGDTDFLVLKLRPDGTAEWQKTYGGTRSESFPSIRQTDDGGYIVAGHTASFGTRNTDFWVLKLRPDGSINPSCDSLLSLNPNFSGMESSATTRNTNADVRDSDVTPQDTSATIQDTTASANFLCPPSAME